MTAVAAFDTTVERDLSAGYALFELCESEDTALQDWNGNEDTLKVDSGRVGVESVAQDHDPELVLTSYTSEPGPLADGYELVGQVEVPWHTDHVELWTSDSDIGQARQLTLPPTSSGHYNVRAARAFAPEVQGDLKEWLWDHEGADTHGLERWRFDLWPA